jgi:hypothetical protein
VGTELPPKPLAGDKIGRRLSADYATLHCLCVTHFRTRILLLRDKDAGMFGEGLNLESGSVLLV